MAERVVSIPTRWMSPTSTPAARMADELAGDGLKVEIVEEQPRFTVTDEGANYVVRDATGQQEPRAFIRGRGTLDGLAFVGQWIRSFGVTEYLMKWTPQSDGDRMIWQHYSFVRQQ